VAEDQTVSSHGNSHRTEKATLFFLLACQFKAIPTQVLDLLDLDIGLGSHTIVAAEVIYMLCFLSLPN
jgi:hypothetical protein